VRIVVFVLAGLLAASVPSALAQNTFDVTVKDVNGAAPPTNATLIFSALDGTNPRRFESDAQGNAEVDVPKATYRVRVFVPNETGELWYDQELDVDPAAGPLSLVRTLPSIARRPDIVGAEGASDGSAFYVPIGTNLEVHVAIRYAGPPERSLVARATLSKGNTTLYDGTIGITSLSKAGWINGSLTATTENPYHANESLTLLRISILQNGTITLFDRADPITVIFRDGCVGDAVQLRATVEGTSVPFCAPATDAAAWQTWQADANALAQLRSEWRIRFQENATRWTFADARDAWIAYQNASANLTARVGDRLDAGQTDAAGFPTWQQLAILRGVVDRNETFLRSAWSAYVDQEAARQESSAYVARLQTLGLIVVVAGASAVGTVAGVFAILRAWRRRAEYWIGYSAQEQETSPLWLTLALSGGLFLVGLVLTALTPLWRILGGGT
jgi:hypothetical protein